MYNSKKVKNIIKGNLWLLKDMSDLSVMIVMKLTI